MEKKSVKLSAYLEKKSKEHELTPQQLELSAKSEEREKAVLKSMGITLDTSKRSESEKIGIINPRALTEAILGREVDWNHRDSVRIIEEVLERDYQDLIHNKDSVLFAGSEKKVSVRQEPTNEELRELLTLQDVKSRLGDGLKVSSMEKRGNRISLDIFIPEKREQILSKTHLTPMLKELLIPAEGKTRNTNSIVSYENGLFVNYSPNRYDSIMQGALGNCYFLAALSAMAWVYPGVLNRIDIDQAAASDPLKYYHFFAGGGHNTNDGWGSTQSSYYTLGYCTANPFFGRSRDWKNGDNWVSYWEQMYARYRFPSDDMLTAIQKTAGGWPDFALREISGSRAWNMARFNIKSNSESQLKSLLYNKTDEVWKTKVPMTAWTWSTNLDNLPTSHAYTVLGVIYLSGDYYVILRNPWGHTEPSGTGMLTGEYLKNHFGRNERWRFSDWDGIFAMRTDVMKANFDAIGYIYL